MSAQAQTAAAPESQMATSPASAAASSASAGTDAAAAPAASAAEAPNAAKDFIRQAFLANEFGIAASQVAIAKAQSPATKAAAQAVLNDGMKVRQDMITAIQGSTSDMHFDQTWSADYKARLAELQTTPDADFDQKYATVQGQVLTNAASLFSAYAATGQDVAVKTFASKTLPTIQADASKLTVAG
ncbi:DUF4142 domain-containing protein [Asticcacaulis sp. EMRT-3]|uniref:DUF4142 domain-containing protein n=1 Tax=Asticcacaulis sp. EMRT-3 TaxID=3040349 RepID=UPI0024AF77AF|nr:DUF4142 domain-containing protein [Asticcacaulis sp. EMRT-3]MDI7775535.1 DUF4142 domain-containing protein [Asticcacaulis sp. EMRT-3]